MRTGPLLLVAMLCVSCSEVSPATSIADDRTQYVPVGPGHGSQPPDVALAETVAGLSNVIRSATLGGPPRDQVAVDGLWLHVEVNPDASDPLQSMQGEWEAGLLLGAVADRTTFEPLGDGNEMQHAAAATLSEFGLQSVSIEVLHPLDAALEVVATASRRQRR